MGLAHTRTAQNHPFRTITDLIQMRETCKVLMAIVIGLFALITSVFAIVFSLTSGMTEAADNFFKAAQQQQTEKAFSYLSIAFRADTSAQGLQRYLSDNSLLNYEAASWNSRGIENNRGKLEGTINTTKGGNIPIRIRFVKEQGQWKIYSIQTLKPGLRPNDPDQGDSESGQSGIVL